MRFATASTSAKCNKLWLKTSVAGENKIQSSKKSLKILKNPLKTNLCIDSSWFIKDCAAAKCPRAINQTDSDFLVTIFFFFVRGDNGEKHLSSVHFFI